MNFLLSFLIIGLTSFSNKDVQQKQVEMMFVRFENLSRMNNGTESSFLNKQMEKENKKSSVIIGQTYMAVLQDLVEEKKTQLIKSLLL